MYTTPTKLSMPNMPTMSFILNWYSTFIMSTLSVMSTMGKESNNNVQFSHVHHVHTSKERWESVRRRLLLLPLDSPAIPLPASWVSMSVAIVSEPPSQCQYPWSNPRNSTWLQDIFLHICEVLWKKIMVVGVNCNFMKLLPLLQLLWFRALKPMGSSYTSKPIKTICDSLWHPSYAVCGYYQANINSPFRCAWDYLISFFLELYCVPMTLGRSEKWNHIDRNLIGGKSELRIIPVGGVKGNCRPYLSQPFTGAGHPSITHKAVTYLDVALPIWSQQSKNYVVLALLSTTRVEYGEKADMADIIGWFGAMGSGSVSAAYEWMAWWEAGPAGKS